MAFNPYTLSLRFRASFLSLNNSSPISPSLLPNTRLKFSQRPPPLRQFIRPSSGGSSSSSVPASCFTWDDVFKIAHLKNDSSDLHGFFDKITTCNRGSDKQHEFIPFIINDQIVGYVHEGFADHLKKFHDVFVFHQNNSHSHHAGNHVTLHPMLATAEERTTAVAEVVKRLGAELIPAIPRHFILRNISIFLARTFSSSVFWDKGTDYHKRSTKWAFADQIGYRAEFHYVAQSHTTHC